VFQTKKASAVEERTEFEGESDRKEYLENKMKDEFQRRTPIPHLGLFDVVCCCKRSLKSKQKEIGLKKIDNELDLQRFIQL